MLKNAAKAATGPNASGVVGAVTLGFNIPTWLPDLVRVVGGTMGAILSAVYICYTLDKWRRERIEFKEKRDE